MDQKIHEYEGEEITLTYDSNRCIHAAECVNSLPSVFDPDKKPWIQVDNDSAEKVKEAVHHCPTGALQYHEADEDEAIPFSLCQGIEQAVRATNSTDNNVIRDWLASRTAEEPVKTILGDFHWDERGLPVDKPFIMVQWQGGELKFVYPQNAFPGIVDLVWPKPTW